MKKVLGVLALLFAIAAGARAQTITTVTGTITDPQGIPYGAGTVTINIAPPGVTSPFITATNAVILFPILASTNASGFFSVQLVANASISPAATQYTFRICTTPVPPPLGTGNSCVTSNPITIAGASQDVSAAVNPLAGALVTAAISPPKPTITLKKGSGNGTNYSTASTTYVDVDAANLACPTITLPVGQKLSVVATGNVLLATAAQFAKIALFDTQPAAVLVESTVIVSPGVVAGGQQNFALSWVVVGDGNIHTVKLQFAAGNASDAAAIQNLTATQLATMVCNQSPSN